ncbi:MAG TPA: HAD family hydrolase, partial [Candidatus Saccharimonadales bacterium]|nr:HAD family hydrolase [Candidatus Saccharimonadales bacterium]
MEYPRAVLSDADGTLVDTVDLIRHGQYETAKAYLTRHGIASHELPDYPTYEALLNQTVGGSARDTLERTVRLLYHAQPHHLEGMDFDALHDMLNPVQDALAPEFIKAYEGLDRFLSRLGRLGIRLAIFTSGTPHHVVRNFGIALPELGQASLYQDKTHTDEEKLLIFERIFEAYYGL